MRKEEWFALFEKRLNALPPAEKQRATDYYRELYSDKYEAGMSEKDILIGFGDPDAAAREILNNYNQENASRSFNGIFGRAPRESGGTDNEGNERTAPAREKVLNGGKNLLALSAAVLLAVFLGYWAAVASVALAGIELAFFAAGVALSVWQLQTLGAGLILLGLFALCLYPFCFAIARMFKGLVSLIKKFYKDACGRE